MINSKSQFAKNIKAVNYVGRPIGKKRRNHFTLNRPKDTSKYDNIINKLLLLTPSDDLASFIANIIYEVPVEYCPNPNIAMNFTPIMVKKITKELIESNFTISFFESIKNKVIIYPSDSSNINLQRIPIYQRLKYFFANIKDYREITIVYTTNSTFDKLLIYLLLSLNKNIKIINKKARHLNANEESPSPKTTNNYLNNCNTQNYEDFPF